MTNIEKVYETFLSIIDDYTWLEIDKDIILKLMRNYLDSSIASFDVCKKDLIIDDLGNFKENLTPLEIKILSRLMLLEYLNPKIIREENLRQSVTTKDYNDFSKANLLKNLIQLKQFYEEDVDKLIIDYDYQDFEGLS
ncbi:hypothetical protein [Paraclostridium sordellii]|uniref:hypothetical protein n=1 Tax=Paraclostridium sordellii TaxID=1505 RepID=UPI0022E5EEA9|nr:hypothetical protein [Paeniclostridium sordellii]